MATVTTTGFEAPGADGGPIRGDVRTADYGRERPAVILCHGFKGFKDWAFFPKVAERLARGGITAVSFNFSGSGIGRDGQTFNERDRFGHATFSNDLADIETVHSRLMNGTLVDGLAQPTRVGLFGHSRGGGMAVLYCGEHPDMDALVTWAAIATVHRWSEHVTQQWRADGKVDVVNSRTGQVLPLYTDVLDDLERHAQRLDILAAAATLACPWLTVHGDQDETVPVQDSRQLSAVANSAVNELVTIGGGSHTMGAVHPWAGSTPQLDHAMDVTAAWFAEHLL